MRRSVGCVRLLVCLLLPAFAWGAAITSNGAGGGNWNIGSTWAGGVVPGNGDTVAIANGDTVTIPVGVSVTVGNSPANDTGTPAIQCSTPAGTGVLVVNGTLIWRGPVRQCSGWTLGAGALIVYDASQAAAPTGANYTWKLTNGLSSVLYVNGSAGSRVSMRIAGGSGMSGGFGDGSYNGGQIVGSYFDVADWGSFNANLHSAGATFDISHCTITRSNPIYVYEVNPDAIWSIDSCSFIDPLSPQSTNFVEFCQFGNCGTIGTGRRNFSNNFANAGQIKLNGGPGVDVGMTFRNNVLKTPSAGYAPLGLTAYSPVFGGDHWNNNFLWFDRASGTNNQYATIPTGNLLNTFVLATDRNCSADQASIGGQVDNNLTELLVPYSTVIDGWVWDVNCAYGVALINGASTGRAPWMYEVKNNIVLPDSTGRGITLYTYVTSTCTQGGSSYCATTSVHNNTFVGNREAGTAGLASTETGIFAGAFTAVRDNLIWQRSNGTGTIISGVGTPAPGSYSGVDHNWTWNISNGTGAYQWYGTSVYTTPPTIVGSGDPQFVDPNRKFLSWCQSKGASDVDNCFSKFAPGTAGYDPSFTVSDLLAYARDGFAPQAQALATASSTGTFVGAVQRGQEVRRHR